MQDEVHMSDDTPLGATIMRSASKCLYIISFVIGNLNRMPHLPDLPFVHDDTIMPERVHKEQRQEYNRHRPMHLIFERLWLGSIEAAYSSEILIANQVAYGMCLAQGAERHRRQGDLCQNMPMLNMNWVTESPPDHIALHT